jgi:hypothetical protein
MGNTKLAFRTIELDIDIGSSAYDYAAIQKSEVARKRSHLTGEIGTY